MGCRFHDELDCAHQCTRSAVTRWGYVMADLICPLVGITIVPGLHSPADGTEASDPKTKRPEEIRMAESCYDPKDTKTEEGSSKKGVVTVPSGSSF